ncbi:hypothetical protein NLU13_3253 [Sarocladium strictum]|uniref:Glycosyl transferase CAP10 domain-containing protein n=1 Tax=Sarocladium strictum TaxID=5046 RepID=A0AA39GLN5_SARSR|nr:hypothetical protein NLU13_3253 [Sarocladium strictum]
MLRRFFTLRTVPSGPIARYVALLCLIGFVATYLLYFTPGALLPLLAASKLQDAEPIKPSIAYGGVQSPIRELMVNASIQFEHLIAKRTPDMWAASSRYRIRRGRHPPPGFDKWVEAATNSSAVIVEDFFDRIYKDLTPFWGHDPRILRERAKGWPWTVSIRNGETITHQVAQDHSRCLEEWSKLVQEFSKHMPDLDMPVNLADEARLLVPFEIVNYLVHEESKTRKLVPLTKVASHFTNLSTLDEQEVLPHEPKWASHEHNHWDMTMRTCNPSSPARKENRAPVLASQNDIPRDWKPHYAFKGFVRNWTAATDPCEQPHLQHMHRAFTQPRSTPATDQLIPLFSGSKLSRNNDILVPGAMYLTAEETSLDGDSLNGSWADKNGKVFWRGDAARLLNLLDGGLVSQLEKTDEQSSAFNLPPKDLYVSARREQRTLGSWLSSIADASSDQTDVSLSSQLANRFLLDVDEAGLSPRFRSLLRSTSLPLKSTLFTEWHDDRLVPWMHFVPLDSTLQDLHAVLEFFADGSGAGDAAARFIAERGAEWADKVLRREDMKLYLWRLLLEWARVVDDNRETLGFTADVREHPD